MVVHPCRSGVIHFETYHFEEHTAFAHSPKSYTLTVPSLIFVKPLSRPFHLDIQLLVHPELQGYSDVHLHFSLYFRECHLR